MKEYQKLCVTCRIVKLDSDNKLGVNVLCILLTL